MSTSLLINREKRLLRVILNRPEKRNALSFSLCAELADALEQAGSDSRVRVILLQAAGKAFCAGMDLAETLTAGDAEQAAIHERIFTAGARLRKPLVAAVHGAALGGGMGLVANAHVVVASEEATFGLTEIRIGLWPFTIYRAVKAAMGDRRVLELSLTGRIFGAEEAQAWGLVHHVVPAPELERTAARVASGLAELSPEAISLGLEFVQQTREAGWSAAGEAARRFRARAFESADFGEGVRAFREKRAPRWPSLR